MDKEVKSMDDLGNRRKDIDASIDLCDETRSVLKDGTIRRITINLRLFVVRISFILLVNHVYQQEVFYFFTF